MDDLYQLRQYGRQTAVVFKTPTLMNQADVDRLRAELMRMVDEEKRTRLIIDFTEVRFLSSQVVGLLLALHKRVAAAKSADPGAELVLCGLRPELIDLLKITRIDRLLTIKPTRKEAIMEGP
jgi:anti-sigma B factor antagonist